MKVYVWDKLAYLPIAKNASSSFSNHFEGQGWQVNQLDRLGNDVEVFGHFRDPVERHFKGTAEFIFQNNLAHLIEDPAWLKIWTHAVFDIHSYPITWAVGQRKIHWIPIATGIDTVELTRKFLRQRNIELGAVEIVNESSSYKKQIEKKLRQLSLDLPVHQNTLSYFYDSDIILWNKIIPYIDEDNVCHSVY